jgi:hypothetical protein
VSRRSRRAGKAWTEGNHRSGLEATTKEKHRRGWSTMGRGVKVDKHKPRDATDVGVEGRASTGLEDDDIHGQGMALGESSEE